MNNLYYKAVAMAVAVITTAIAIFPYTYKDADLLAEVMYWENWHTDSEHKAAYYTGAVVMNRVRSKNWPGSIEKVLYQKGQYITTKYFFTKEIPDECRQMAIDILKWGTEDVPVNVVFQSTFSQGSGKWKIINGEWFCFE